MLRLLVKGSSGGGSHSSSSTSHSYSAPSHSAPSESHSYSAPAKSATTAQSSSPSTTKNTATTSKPAQNTSSQSTVIVHTNTVYVNNNSNDHFWTWYWLTHRNQPVQAQYQNTSYTTQASGPDDYNASSDSNTGAWLIGGVLIAVVLIGTYLWLKED